MIHLISSKCVKASDALTAAPREAGEDNLAWLGRHLGAGPGAALLLVGGRCQLAFRLRAAQAHVRHDLLPSYWSHVMLLGRPARNLANTPVHEISLDPPSGFGFPAPRNGVQIGRLGTYRDPEAYPNVCVLRTPVDPADLVEPLQRFQKQRAVLDAVDLTVRWIAYAWGVGGSPNPLLEHHGMPSAAMIEVVFGAAGFDLTPGLESRASCPEAIWQAAKWWHEYYTDQQLAPLTGAYHCGHEY